MKTAVLIPAFNASSTLPELLKRTINFISQENILVVDDGSFDSTSYITESFGVDSIRHEKNRGKGAALQTGFSEILKSDFDAVITMDADLQHEPEEILNFLDYFSLMKCDIIIGSRLHDKQGMPLHRIVSNTVTTFLVQARIGRKISDSQSGFRFIHRRVLEAIKLQSPGFEAETEFLIKSAALGFSFGSIPIKTIYTGGKSNMTHVQTTINFLRTLLKPY
jgi:glycosyltransferase involved in cell wall biosynthesis